MQGTRKRYNKETKTMRTKSNTSQVENVALTAITTALTLFLNEFATLFSWTAFSRQFHLRKARTGPDRHSHPSCLQAVTARFQLPGGGCTCFPLRYVGSICYKRSQALRSLVLVHNCVHQHKVNQYSILYGTPDSEHNIVSPVYRHRTECVTNTMALMDLQQMPVLFLLVISGDFSAGWFSSNDVANTSDTSRRSIHRGNPCYLYFHIFVL